MMYNFAFNAAAAQLFLALSAVGTPTTAADFIGSIAKAPPPANVDRRLQQAECVCSPRAYTFKLMFVFDFDQTCDVNTIDGKPGIVGTSCQPPALTPVVIDSVQILELNRDLQMIAQKLIPGPFIKEDKFSYTSVSAQLTPDEPLVDQEVPSIIVLILYGRNVAGIPVNSQVSWEYNLTNCDDEPIMTGDKIGIIEVDNYETANPAFCPAIATDPPTSTPSLSPTDPPTATSTITIPPTAKPTPEPTIPPTPSPVAGSMSYAASFSLSHMSKASKGKAHNAGKGKSGKLIRQRS